MRTKSLNLLLLFFIWSGSIAQTTNSYTSNGTYSWTCPAGVTSVSVQCWGAGGAGGGATTYGNGGAGGAGGAYSGNSNISVIPGNTYTIKVGKGGAGVKGNGSSGGDSWFSSSSTIIAKGGAAGQANNSGSAGVGSTTGCIGTVIYKGGDGQSGYYAYGAGGGGAGSTGNGGNGSTYALTGGTGTSVGGGNGGNGTLSSGNGNPGSGAGGGGAGAWTSGSTKYSGGSGADGRVDITYTISLSVSGTSTITCVGGSTGQITVSVTGGTSPYTYSLNGGTYQSSNLFTGLAAGTYSLTAKDNNGNTGSVNVTVSAYGTSSDNQNMAGTDTWIGHIYDGTNFSTYIGHFTEAETFNEGFGGSYTCFDVASGASTSSIYTETFSVKFRMNSTRRGLYVVDLGSDDGSRLTVDGSLIYNNWSDQSFSTKSNVLMSLTGSSTLLYEYYENGGGNQVIFQNLSPVLTNTLSANTTQNICIGSAGSPISGDVYGSLPSGISLSGTGYQWTYSTTPGGTQTNIAGATGSTFTPSTSVAPFNTPGTYYIYRNASLTSTNNVSPDPYTASNTSNAATIVVNSVPTISQIPTSNLIGYYKFNGNANDAAGNDNGTLQGSPASTTDRFGNSTAAYNFNGSSQYVSTANSYSNPSNFTISIWFKTNTSGGGKLIGFGNSQTGQSSEYDRHLYMNNAGQVYFGVYPNTVKVIYSPKSYNDNQWHLATATLSSSAGMSLYIDGALVASDLSVTTAQNYTGYWKIGYDNVSGWTSSPSSNYFSGTLDDALIYSTALTSTQIATLYNSPDGAGNNGPVCAGSTLTLSATTVSGAGYAWTGPNSFSSSSQNPSFTYSTAYAGTYTLTVTGAGGCTATAYTNIVSSATAGQWVGGFSANWNSANNWCNGTVPDISTNVTIPSSSTFSPVISDDQYAADIVINTGATLNVNSGGTLQIGGSITNNGTFVDSSGTIEMSGTSAQTIPANTFYNNRVNNLVIKNTSATGVTLGGTLDIYNSLTYAGTGMTLNTNDNLTIKSNANGTARVGDMTGNTINGKVTVERYLEAKKAWRLLSVPTNTTQTISAAWQEGCGPNSNCVTGFGTQITGPGGTSAGFDVQSASPSIETYNSSTGTYAGVPATNSTGIATKSGYMIFVRGDRNTTTVAAPANSTVIRSKGPLYTGTQSAINVAASKYAVIGNPYASALDMRNIAKTGMKDFFYVWDPMLSGTYGYGGFQTFSNNGSGNYVVTPGGGSYGANGSISNYIQSGQAFFMQAQASGGSVTMSESAKTSGSSIVNAPVAVPSPALTVNLYGIDSKGTNYMADGFMVNYGSQYSNAVDDMDAFKSANSTVNLSDKRGNSLLVVERRQPITNSDTIYFNLTGVSIQNYYFVINTTSMSQPGLTAYLLDNYSGTKTPLQVDGSTTVNFSFSSTPASYVSNRFEIVFDNPAGTLPVTFTNVHANPGENNVKVLWNVQNEVNIKNYAVEHSADGINFNTIATLSPAVNNGGPANYQATDTDPADGINFYRIMSTDIDGKINYSQIVKVNLTNTLDPGETVFPNPIVNNEIHLRLSDKDAGNYQVRLISNDGRLLTEQVVTNPGGSYEKTIKVPSYLATGVYHLEIIDPAGSGSVIKIIKR